MMVLISFICHVVFLFQKSFYLERLHIPNIVKNVLCLYQWMCIILKQFVGFLVLE